jgi:hypothetical protein
MYVTLHRLSMLHALKPREERTWKILNVIVVGYFVTPKAGTDFADKRRSLGRYSSLADSGRGVNFF